MKTVAIVNNKGGVGRTTLAVHLALHASALGIKTTAVSLCRQGDLYAWLSGGQRAASAGDVMQISSCLDVVFSPDEIPELGEASLVVYDCPSIFTIPVRDDVVRAPPTTPCIGPGSSNPPSRQHTSSGSRALPRPTSGSSPRLRDLRPNFSWTHFMNSRLREGRSGACSMPR